MTVRTSRLGIRITEKEMNRIKLLAGMYADGNVSQWMVYGALNVRPKLIGKSHEKSKLKKKK